VIKKFGDDRAGNLAALIAYYGFFSLFPLLLVFVTVVSFVIRGNPPLQQRIVDSALSQFPIIGHQIASNVHAIKGSAVALTLGVVGALWGGMGVVQAAQNAMNEVWNVPYKQQPNFLKSRLRAVMMLAVLGVAAIGSAVLTGLSSSGGGLGILIKAVAVVAAFALNLGLFLAAYRILTVEDLSWADVLPGALIAAVLWSSLQYLGTYYVGHQLKSASEVYGFFAVVIGLLSWIYVGAQLTLLCAEINVVRKRRLWPRSLVQPPLTEPDKRVLEQLAKEEERRPEEKVEVQFADHAGEDSDTGSREGDSAPAR
jgi:YihY family inner membrane protein